MFLYTNNELSKNEIKETIPFIIASKNKNKVKYLGVNLTKAVKKICTMKTTRLSWNKDENK